MKSTPDFSALELSHGVSLHKNRGCHLEAAKQLTRVPCMWIILNVERTEQNAELEGALDVF